MAYQQNSRTLVATFNDYDKAQQAARELESNGVSHDAVHVDASRTSASSSDSSTQHENHEGGFMGWWNSLFGSDDETERNSYQGALESGNAILRATVPAEVADTSVEILNRYGAVDVDQLSGSQAGMSTSKTGLTGGTTERTGNAGPIQVMEEELQVGKRAVRRGGVRIYSHVVSKPVEEQINLREEHVNVERRPVNREVNPSELNALRDQTIEVTETAEEAVVNKRARVVEEVVVGKESTNRTETIRDNVRHTEVEVESLGSESDRLTGTGSAPTGAVGTGQKSTGVKATGLSPHAASPSVMSGGGSTAGAGTLAGQTTQGVNTQDMTSAYRKNFETTYGADRDFETMRPAYEHGSRYARDVRYSGKSWNDVERDLRSDYERNNPGSTWDQVKGAVRHGWDKVSGQS
jgi:uncharacterized protein (TIGR02271 family)